MAEQGSQEWLQQRLGKVTASKVSDVMARTKTGYAASRANYMAKLIVERLTGKPQEEYTNGAMQWGKDNEPKARAAYEFITDNKVEEVGFLDHPAIFMSGASPDGLIGDDGLLEIKCPNSATHIDTLLGSTIPDSYIKQMQWQMACTGRKWCDFMSYDPRLPAEMQIHIARVERNDTMIEEMEKEVLTFLSEVDEKLTALRKVAA